MESLGERIVCACGRQVHTYIYKRMERLIIPNIVINNYKELLESMSDIDEIIGAFVALFIVSLLGYAFYIVLSALSPGLAILFIVAMIIVAIAIVLKLFRG
jgi:hypothetical protein